MIARASWRVFLGVPGLESLDFHEFLMKIGSKTKFEKHRKLSKSLADPMKEHWWKTIGEKGKLLTENLKVSVSFYNDAPILVDLPNQVNCKVKSTDAALKGQTVSSSYKPAILDNGLHIQVPPFIETGNDVVIDTRNLEYVKKI